MASDEHRSMEQELVRLVKAGGDQYPLTESRFRIVDVDLDGEWPATKILIRCDGRFRGGQEVFDYELWNPDEIGDYSLALSPPSIAAALMLADVMDS